MSIDCLGTRNLIGNLIYSLLKQLPLAYSALK